MKIFDKLLNSILFLMFFTFSNIFCQNLDNSRFGVFGNSVINIYNASFPALDSVPSCCVNYLSGNGISLNLGAFWSQNLSHSLFLDSRISYLGLSGDFYSYEIKPVSVLINNKEEIIDAKIQHNISARIGSTNLDLNLKYFITNSISIFSGVGLSYIIINEFNQKESLIQPSDYGSFENKRRTRNEYNGEILNTNKLLFRSNFGISYDFYLNKNKSLIITPEFSFNLGLNSYLQSNKWIINNFRLGFAIVFAPRELDESPIYPKTIIK